MIQRYIDCKCYGRVFDSYLRNFIIFISSLWLRHSTHRFDSQNWVEGVERSVRMKRESKKKVIDIFKKLSIMIKYKVCTNTLSVVYKVQIIMHEPVKFFDTFTYLLTICLYVCLCQLLALRLYRIR